MLTDQGIIYSLGSNQCGKLGVGRAWEDLQYTKTPIKIDLLGNVATVVTGEDHSMALTKDFKVYGWGQAEHGAIGMRLSNAKVPNLINVFNERA